MIVIDRILGRILGPQIGNTVLHPVDQPFPKTPSDYGLNYQDVEFETRDGVKLSGWLINEDGSSVVIMTHFGYRANRFGYQTKYQGRIKPYDKEIEFVLVAKQLVKADYAVLMYDLRNHGISGKSQLGVGTGGIEESNDVLAAVEFVKNHEKLVGKDIGLLSYCMGANSTFYAQGKNPDLFRENVKALVAMQPLTNGCFLRAYGFNKHILNRAASHYQKFTGYSLDEPILDLIEKVNTPTLLAQGLKDPWTSLDFVRAVYDTIPTEKEMYWLEETDHRFDGYNYFGDHPERMLEFFGKYLN